MRRHGVRFQPSLSGTLHLSRTNAFFMGGGKALVNAYYRSAEALGVQIRYDTPVARLELDGGRFVAAHIAGGERIAARACVVASGGFESNLDWLREAWGTQRTRRVAGRQLPHPRHALQPGRAAEGPAGAGRRRIGDPTQAHMVAIDARAPLYDGGICTRVDCVSLGIMVNRDGQRFYDEGEDFWPKRYAIWGRLVAQQPGQIGYSHHRRQGGGAFHAAGVSGRPGRHAARTGAPARPARGRVPAHGGRLQRRLPCRHASTTRCSTTATPKAWRRPRRTGRCRSTRRPSTATRCSRASPSPTSACSVDDRAAVHFGGRPSDNLFAAGEMMAGNVLGKGYTAGVGMTIGTVFGRIAGASAAAAARSPCPGGAPCSRLNS